MSAREALDANQSQPTEADIVIRDAVETDLIYESRAKRLAKRDDDANDH